MFDQNYFLTRLQNGEDMEKIGQEIADMMNKASAEFEAQKEAEAKVLAETEKAEERKELVHELIQVIQELSVLDGLEPEDFELDEDEVDRLAASFSEMFAAMRDLKKLFDPAPVKKISKLNTVKKTDDQILADFLKSIV
jgi:hypothetical protein